MRVHRLSCFVVPLHCTFTSPLEVEDDVEAVGEGGLDDALGRFVGVSAGDGRELGAEDAGLAGAEFGACCRCGRCGVARLEDGNAFESECRRVSIGGRR